MAACGSKSSGTPAAKKDAGAAAPAEAAVAIDAAVDAPPRAKVFLHGAGRCGECHGKMYDEWETSAHAKAATSELYLASARDAKDTACEHCHAPLAADTPKGDAIASEGVTCDVCHTLRKPEPSPAGGRFELAIDDMVKYGPRCDLKDHYFHRMGCSPEHKEAPLCGSCHWWERNGVPVFTEYKDWADGPAAKSGEPCQSCHMPKARAQLAEGAPVRDNVPDHGLLGPASDLRKTALGLEASVDEVNGQLEVKIALANLGAGHPVPAGLPERRIVVTTRVRGPDGAELASRTTALGRVLLGPDGKEAPFWRAVKVGEDRRIQPNKKQEWTETLPAPPGAGTVEIEVEHRKASDALLQSLGVTETERQSLIAAKVAFGAPAGGKHANLPKSVTVAPEKAAMKKPKRDRK